MLTSLKEAASKALTGLPNRRALIADSDMLFRLPSPQHVLSVYDLDGFKQYNDTFGNDDGDTMLTMASGSRPRSPIALGSTVSAATSSA